MTSPVDREWTQLVETWRSGELPGGGRPIPEVLRRRVRGHGRRLVALTLFEVLLTLTVIGGVIGVFRRHSSNVGGVITGFIVLHTGVIWGFTWWNRRGTWRPLVQTTAAYLDLAHERCRRQLRSIRFVIAILLVEAVGLGAWIALGLPGKLAEHAGGLLRSPPLLAILLMGILGFGAWLVWFRRRTWRAMAEFAAFRARLGDEGGGV